MRFADQLRSRSPEALAELLALRPDLLAAADDGFDAMAAKASSPMSLGRCLVQADVGMLVVAEALVVSNPATADEIDELLGTDDVDAVIDALARLEHYGLVMIDQGVATPVGKLHDLLQQPLGLGPSVIDLWRHLPAENREAVAETLEVAGARSERVTARAVARRMRGLEGVACLLDGAPDGTADKLAYLATQRSPALALPAGAHRRDHTELLWLLDNGLVVAVDEGRAELPREVVIALTPQGFAPGAALRPIAVEPVVGLGPDAVEGAAADQAGRSLEAVEALLRLAGEGIAVRKLGGVGVREIARLARSLAIGEQDVARLVELTVDVGLISVEPGRLAQTDMAAGWTELSRARRWLVLVRAWIASPRFLSWALSLDGEGKSRPALDGTGPDAVAVPSRRVVLAAIASLGAGEAYDADQVAEAAVWQSPSLWGTGEPTAELLVSWTLEEAELLGLTALNAPTAVVASLVAGGHEEAEDLVAASLGDDQDRFLLQSDLTAVALGPLEPSTASRLADLADRVGDLAVPTYRFTESSLRHGFDRGWRSETIETFLTDHALSGVPQPLLYLVADVERRYGSVRVMPATSVVITDDEATAVEIASTKRAAKLGLRLVAPNVLIGPVEPLELLDELRIEGLFPTLDGSTIQVASSNRDPHARAVVAGREPDVPVGWTSPPLVESALPGEIEDAVSMLLDGESLEFEGGEIDDRMGLHDRLQRLWNRPALVHHLRNGELVQVKGVLIAIDETLTLLGESGIDEVPIDSVVSAEDPAR